MKLGYILTMFFIGIFIFFRNVYALTYISGCSLIDKPYETYILKNDISNSTTYCLYITTTNVVIDCQNHKIDGKGSGYYGIVIVSFIPRVTNVTIKNCEVQGWKEGIWVVRSNSNNLQNLSLSSNEIGIELESSSFNTITNVNTHGNKYYGIILKYSNSNKIENVSSENNDVGIALWSSNSNDVKNSIIRNNRVFGIDVWSSKENTLYENIFINKNNVRLKDAGKNFWNSQSKGNYWGDPEGVGFSDRCYDLDRNGICDGTYKLDDNNIDYFPIVNKEKSWKDFISRLTAFFILLAILFLPK
jgi:parallel beta-helix repeat protein